MTHPIDLGTIKKQLESGSYRDVEHVKTDIARVWENCAIYNPKGSAIINMANTLAQVFDEKISALPDESVRATGRILHLLHLVCPELAGLRTLAMLLLRRCVSKMLPRSLSASKS